MNNLDEIYNIKDFYIVEYGPNTQKEGLKLSSQLDQLNMSPRSNMIAPPNRPVKEYMMHDSKRELALQKMMQKKEAVHSQNDVEIDQKIKPDELNALNNKTNYPKAAMRL